MDGCRQSCGQWFYVQVEAGDVWYPSTLCPGADALRYLNQWQTAGQVHPQQDCRWLQAECCSWHNRGMWWHPDRPGQTWGVSPQEPKEVQQTQVQVLHLSCGNSRCKYRLGEEDIKSSLVEKDLGTVDEKLDINHQVNGVHSQPRRPATSWASWRDSSSGRLFSLSSLVPGLGSPAQERCAPVRVGPEEGLKDDLKPRTPLLLKRPY